MTEITKEIIWEHSDNPERLEELYRTNKKSFSETIKAMYVSEPNILITYWYVRLFPKPAGDKHDHKLKYAFSALLIVLVWIPVRLTIAYDINAYLFIAIPAAASFAWTLYYLGNPLQIKYIAISFLSHLFLYGYFVFLLNIISLPPSTVSVQTIFDSQSVSNAFYFMFILLWFFVLFAYSDFKIKALDFSGFLEITGEIIVWSVLLIIGGSIIVGLSLALFSTIEVDVTDFYFHNVVTLGLTAAPFVSLLIIEKFDKIKLSVIIANIFLPLILLSILVFGVISMLNGIKPYDDKDIFIVYNVMMVIIISVLVFTSINTNTNRIIDICSYILPVAAIILDAVTLSAVIYRLTEYGVTANKVTLLGTNLVMAGHLIYILYLKIKDSVKANVNYLPIYALWALCVVFVFPFIFK